MNGGRASPAVRPATPESAARSRAKPARAAPVRQAPATVAPGPGQAPVTAPSTRERIRAAAVATGATPGEEAAAPALALVPLAEEQAAPTMRDRIVSRARAAEETAPVRAESGPPAASVVVDLAAERERRRERRSEPPAEPAGPGAPLAPVITLVSAPELARPPPAAQPAEASGPESAPPAEAELEKETETEGAAPIAEAALAAAPTPTPGAPEAAAAAGPEHAEIAEGGEEPETGPSEAEAEPGAEAAEPVVPEGVPVAEAPAPAVAPPVGRNPEDDPAFQAMEQRSRGSAARATAHQPGKKGAATAQGASAPEPEQDVAAQAAGEKVERMGEQEPGPFDAADFKRRVKEAVEGMAPPATLEEADEFEESGKAGAVTGQIRGVVQAGQAVSQHDIETETETPPDPAGKTPKPVTEMVNDRAGPRLPDVRAGAALPGPRPPEQTDLSEGPRQIDAKMAEGNLTEDQLANANEPEFTAVLAARDEVREHAATAPGEYRAEEELVLADGRAGAEGAAAGQLETMHGSRAGTLAGVLDVKNETKDADERQREDVNQALVGIHERTQADVTTILAELDRTVDTTFTNGEKAARERFESYVDRKMREYKDERYSGVIGRALWLSDKLFDLPEEVNAFYRDGRAQYLADMDRVIDEIATVVATQLTAAQTRIQAGRDEVRSFLDELPRATRKLGEQAAADLDHRFDQLSADVEAKRDELVDAVARRYVESRDALDKRIEDLKEANKGLVSKGIDATVGVAKTVYELGKLLLRVLLKAASAIGDIVRHPIRFLGNLVGALKGGLERFVSRIAVHLQRSLLEVLFGELGKAGITMPKALDFPGILDLVLQVLGLTYASVRERVVKRFGEPLVARMEQVAEVFAILVREDLAGLWKWIREKLADLEDLVVGKIKAYITDRVVSAGIGYIVALLNPAAAFIKACQGIYRIVTFVVERARQIADFVDAVLDSIGAIAQGNLGGAIEKIETALAGGLSLAIKFLARLANLGALSETVRSIIQVVRKPIMRVVDQVVFGAAEVYRRTIGPALAFAKTKVQSGKDFLKGKTKADKERLERGPEDAEKHPPAKVAAAGDAPVAPVPAPDAGAAGPLVVHEAFSIEGHQHDLYTGEDGKRLILASLPEPTPVTAVPDPSGTLARLHGQYVTARAVYDRALAVLTANPRAKPGIGAARAQVNMIIRQVVARLRQLRPDDSPGASAPGLGDKGRHGEKRTSIRFGPKLWHLESEHVIPFAVGKLLWDAAGEMIPRRGRAADRRQTTIMIYKGAADGKTQGHDKALWTRFRAQYDSILRPRVRGLQIALALAEDRGGPDAALRTAVEEALEEFKKALMIAGASAVDATKDAVRDEHADATGGGPTNGTRRAEAAPLPREDQIRSAAAEQYIGIYKLVQTDVERGIGR
jgi:hypothetical protein